MTLNIAAVIGSPTVNYVTEDTSSQTLTAVGSISISDANAGQAAFKTSVTATAGDLGTLTLAANGNYTYSVADSAVQYLGAGDVKTDTFTISSVDGTTKQVAFTIHGVNDAAVIGTPTVVNVTEDASSPTLKATGSIAISDADQGQAAFKTTIVSAGGNLGSLTIASNGSYSYTVADSAVQYLGAGDVKTDTFTVTALDGTTRQVFFNIHGTNDAAVIGTPTVHDVTEDASQPTLTAIGSISISDADQNQAAFKTTVTPASGNLGNLVLAANGTYTYSVADSAVQYLGAGDTKVDTFTVTSLDGTSKQVSFTIHGVNDAAVIGTPTVHDVTEDATIPFLTAIGTVSISDADQGEAAFQPALLAGNGNLGLLAIASNGAYIYIVADGSVQYLGAGDTKVDTFTLTALDGTTKQVSFTIHGSNDVAVIGTPTVHDVTEDANPTTLTAAGTISIFDADQNQSSFQTGVVAASGALGHLTIAANGAYTYSVADSAVQYLGAGDTRVDSFTVTSFDGTTKQVSFTIHGVNDAAVIGDPLVHDVTKNASPTTLTASGVLSISDADQNQSAFQTTVIPANGNLGHLTIAANGAYTYSVANSATQYLGAADTKTDTFTVTALDGTTRQIAFTIHGGSANQPAVIGDPPAHDVTEDAASPTLTATGTISIIDSDAGQAAFQTSVNSATGNLGSLVIASNGVYTYSVPNSATQYLGAADTKVDTFTITSVDGTTKQVSFTIHGINDAAVIGTPTVHDVTQNNALTTLTATGSISISDADQGQGAFQSSVISANGNLGSLALGSNGSYTYSVANGATQYLGATDSKVDTFTVTSLDGTTSQVSFTIRGTNDAASIGTPTVHDVTQNNALSTLTATGSISISDPDQGQGAFQTSVVAANGTLGSLALASNGTYTYSVANSATQYLGATDSKVDTFTVTSVDGTTSQVSFTIHGTNDAASIGTPTVHDVTQNNALTTLTATGSISISDPDQGQGAFHTSVVAANGTLGSLALGSDGTYTYSVADSATQYLGATDSKVDTFTVTSVDGTTSQVNFTIHGTNDAAMIGTPTVHDVTEDVAVDGAGHLTATGTLSIADPDQGQASFQTIVTGTAGNLGSLALASNGVYTYSVADSATQYLGASDTQTDTFTVTAFDGTTQQVSFAIHGTQDAPTLTVGTTASGLDNANISLSVAAGLIDTSNSLVVSVAGVPTSFTLNHGAPSDDGSTWLVNPANLADLALVPVGGLAQAGNFSLHVVASSGDGTHVATTSADIAVTVSQNPNERSGFGEDGYIAGATVFADADGDGILDHGEVWTTTAGDGSFTLNGGSGPLVMFGGTDISTNLSFTGTLKAPEGSTVVTPLTTLIAAIVATGTPDHPVSTADAAGQVAAAFGLDTTKDLTTYDPVADAIGGNQAAAAILSAGIQVQSTVAQVSAVGGSSDAVFSAIANSVTTSDTTSSPTVDLSASSTVQDIVSNSGVGADAASAVANVVSAANSSIQSAGTDVTALAQAAVVAQGAATTQLHTTDFSDSSAVAALQQTYVTDLGTQVTNAVVGVTGLALVGTLGADVLPGGAGNDSIDGLDGNDTITGGAGNDLLYGSGGNDTLTGGAGDDRIDGGAGSDRASYADATAGVTIDLTAGTAHGTAAGDVANVGNDTLVSIENVTGSDFADVYSAVGFTGTTGIPGRPAGISEFEGKGGDDVITGTVNASGQIMTRISYVSATAGVTVDLAAGTAHGTAAGDVAGVGNDTFTNVNQIVGSGYDDTLSGSNNPNGTFEQFDGRAGNDLINGRGGYDFAVYNNDPNTTTGITVQLATGTVTGDATIGTDTLRSVEAVRGTNFADTYDATGFSGGSTNAGSSGTFNNFDGEGGNDTIIGNGNTRIQYSQSSAAVTVDIAAGTAHGTAAGDLAGVGTDSFSGVNAVMGSAFDDTLLGGAGNETFMGLAGNDFIDGRGGFDVAQYSNLTFTTGAISVDMASGTVTGDASTGTDTLRSIEGVQGTIFNDTYVATNFGATGFLNPAVNNVGNNGTFNQFEGLAGNDTITGNGNTRIIYQSASGGVTINLQAGTASGDASVGTDTYVGVNSATGSSSADTYNAAGFTGTTSAGSFGTFNLFEGLGGNDTIIGNGNTRVAYTQATAAVTVDLGAGAAHGTAAGDLAGVGSDTITGGVNSVQGSNFNDLLIGGSGDESFIGGSGNDTINSGGGNDNITGGVGNDSIDGGAGTDISVYTGARGGYTITMLGTGQFQVADLTPSRDGTDTLSNVEVLQFTDSLVLGRSSTAAAPIDISNFFVGNSGPLIGTAGDDYLTIGFSAFNRAIDLGTGNNTVTVGVGGGSLNLTNVQHLVGSSNGDFVSLVNNANGLSVDLGGGTDTLVLANGANTLSASNIETINGNDFNATSSNDSLTLQNDVSGVSINLGNGINTLNLAAGTNAFDSLFNVDTINVAPGDNTLTIGTGLGTPNNDIVINMGTGDNTLNLGVPFASFSLLGVEHLNGNAFANYIEINNDVSGLAVDLGDGTDTLNLAGGTNSVSVTNVEFIDTADFFNGGPASNDTLTLLNDVAGLTVNLQQGNNTLDLAAGANSLTLYNIQNVNGSASNDQLTLQNQVFGTTIDLGGGTDTLTLADGGSNVTVNDIENVIGGNGNDNIVVANVLGTTTVTGGLGQDSITAGAAPVNIRFTSVADSAAGSGDTVTNFNAASDTFVLDHVAGLASPVHFVGSGPLDGTQSEAVLNGNVLQIDVDGDGQIGAGDMEVYLNGLTGTLSDANFTTPGVTAVNHAPTNILLSNASIAENTSPGSVVGVLSDVDQDAGDTATYVLTDDAGGRFAISGNNLVVAGALDFETAPSNVVTVQVTDSANHTFSKSFTIGVTDVNEAPTAVTLSNQVTSTAENGGNIKVADIAVTDDALGTNSLSLSGADATAFSIVTGTGGPELHFNGGADFQVKASYDVTVNVNDATASNHVTPDASQNFHLAITNVNHAPTDIALSNSSIAENSNPGSVVGVLSDVDQDAGDTATYVLTNDAGGRFAVSGNNLVVAGALDFETAPSDVVTVQVTDSANHTFSKSFTIGVTDVNEAPTAVTLSNQVISTTENGGNIKVADIAVTDDALGTDSLSLSGADAAAFSIVTGAGGPELHFNGSADFETKASYDVTVNVNDATASNHVAPDASQNFHLAITNVNEAPTNIALAGNSVPENSANGTFVGVLTSTDPDAADTATYTLTNNAGGRFAISGNTLVVNGPLDYETAASRLVTVRVTDSGGLTYDKNFTIGVTDVNEGPTAITLSNQVTSTPENGGDVKVADIAITDDALGSNALSLSGADAAFFTIVNGTGGKELHFAGGANFEAKTSYDVTVNVNDASASNHVTPDASQNFHLVITNVDETPTNIALSNSVIGQSSANGTVVGVLSATDPDVGDSATFSLINNAGGQFSLSGSNLVVAGALSAGAQQVIVRDTDAGGLSFDKTITITVSSGATVVGDANANSLLGTSGDDIIQGLAGGDRLQGLAGNDLLDGGDGFDRAIYSDATAGISFNLASGTVTGAGVGTDTLVGIEGIVGTSFADTYDATGFTGMANVPGSPVGFNEFEGGGGNDQITGTINSQGAALTRVSYISASAAVTVDLQAKTGTGTAAGDVANVGSDTFIGNGVANVIGSGFADTLLGSNNGAGTVEVFDGRAGNDTINGRGGFDRADYNNDPATTTGITVNMASGTVTGDSTIGTDTLRSVEAVRGTNFADTYVATGFAGNSTNAGSNGTFNEFTGNGGDDTITGNGNTRLNYNNATAAVTVNIATGNAHGTAAGDLAGIGTDSFSGVNAVMGSMFNDTLTGSGSASTETFTGLAGDDVIDGGNGFDISSYNNIYFTTGAITVNMAAGTVTGDASIGSDTLRSIEGVQGTNFADTFNATGFGIAGALNIGNNGTFNQFEGVGGNDTITGNGNTRVIYSSATGGVTINLQAGTAVGDASVGSDTFSGVNSATGSSSADTYIATGFVGTGASNQGTFNLFEGLGGSDTITGNGNTRIAYSQAAAAVTVDLSLGTAHGTVAGDAATVGTDVITGGVNSAQGSNFDDTLIGGGGNELFFGGSGNDTVQAGGGNDQITGQAGSDTIDGGAGTDMAIYTGPMANYTITTPVAGQTQVADSLTTRDGTDILTNVEILQFSDVSVLLSSGSAGSPIDVSSFGLGVNGAALKGTTGDDYLMVGGNSFGHQLDLAAGNDTVALANGVGFFQLNLVNVEYVVGSAGNDTISLVNDAIGLSVDLGAGNNAVNLANGVNSLTVANVQNISATDFSGSSDDTLTLLNDVSGLTVNLGNGNNTLNLAAGTNSLVDIFSVQHINGTASDDALTVTDSIASPTLATVDLGGGDNTLNIDALGADLTLLNVQHLNGNGLDNFFTLENNASGMAIDLGAGNDAVNLAAGTNSIAVSNVESVGSHDFSGPGSDDTLTLLNNVSGVTVNLQLGDNTLNLAAGSNSLVDIFNVHHINGTAADDVLTLSDGVFSSDGNPIVDLGAGDNTLNFGAQFMSLTALNIQHINGSATDGSLGLHNDVTGVSIDLGAGNTNLTLANGTNSMSLTNVDSILGSDFTGGTAPSDDTLTLLNDVSGLTVNLGDGNNTLNLAAGVNSLDNLFNINHLNGSSTDDSLTVTQQSNATIFDMGAGNDVINFTGQANNVTVMNAETVNGSTGNDSITVANTSGSTTVTGGLGSDTITASAAADNFRFTSSAESAVGAGDTVVNFDANSDTFTFANMSSGPNAFAGPVHFVGTAGFDGSAGAPHSEARVDTAGGNATLQIDVNGDGQFGANDIEIHLTNYTGALHDANFIIT